MKHIRGSPVVTVPTLDRWFASETQKAFITPSSDKVCMTYYDFEQYDTQDEKDALWGGY